MIKNKLFISLAMLLSITCFANSPIIYGPNGPYSLQSLSDGFCRVVSSTIFCGGSASAPINYDNTTGTFSARLVNSTVSGVLSNTDWSTFNSKQNALNIGNLTDAGTDGIIVTSGTGAVIGSGTSISQHISDSTHNGYLSSTDWSTFNGKQSAGNYITALTGDVTASGPGSVAATLATVNSNVGSFGSSTSIPSFTVNAKGLLTVVSGNVVIAPAGTLTGTTLASNVVSSSLTSLGIQSTALNMGSHLINNVTNPSAQQDAATRNYVDTGLATKITAPLTGDVTTSGSVATLATVPITKGGTGQTAITNGSVLFSQGTSITEDNANFYYDQFNHRLGIGTTSPTYDIDLVRNNAPTPVAMEISNTSNSNSAYAQQILSTDAGSLIFALGSAASGGVAQIYAGAAITSLNIRTLSSIPFTFGTNNTTRLTIAGAGDITQTYPGTSTANTITANSLTSGNILSLTSNSTAAAAGNTGLNIAVSGANGTNAITRYGLQSAVTATNATSGTNIAGYFSASGATTANYGLIVNAGNVGIGTTAPVTKLEIGGVTGTVPASGNIAWDSGSGLNITNSSTNATDIGAALSFRTNTIGGGSYITPAAIVGALETSTNNHANGYLGFFTRTDAAYATERMRITSAGFVGVGNTAPRTTLDILSSGTANLSGDIPAGFVLTGPSSGVGGYTGQLVVQSNDAQAADKGGSIAFGGRYINSNSTGAYFAAIQGAKENSTTSNLAGYLAFRTRTTGNADTEKMRIDSAGNVGIGTPGPLTILDVTGTGATVSGTNAYNLLALQDHSTYRGVGLGYDSSGQIGTITATTGSGASSLAFWTYSGSVWAEKMRIAGAGNVGIGTASPGAQLHTTGTVRFANFGAGTATFDASGNISSVSDMRLKKLQRTFTQSIESLVNIVPIVYKWNEKSGMEQEHEYIGFSAQNVQENIPGAVLENKHGYLSFNDRAITAALVNAVKDLKLEIEELKKNKSCK